MSGIRRALLFVILAAVVWSLAVWTSGGFAVNGPFGRISSRDAIRPLVAAGLLGILYLLVCRRWIKSDFAPVTALWHTGSQYRTEAAAAALSCVALFIAIHWGSFVAGGADASGYISQAELWLHGDLIRPRPEWVAEAPWPKTWLTTPLGYVPGVSPLTMVPSYPPGLPLVMALFQAVGGRRAVYYVVPMFGALAIWVTYLLGKRLAAPSIGLLASALLLASPAFLFMLVAPMSDIPAAAMWVVALYFATRQSFGSAVACGLATALAILIRPNLAPLSALVALVMLMNGSRRFARLAAFGASAATGPIAVAAVNGYLYGSPFVSGYGKIENLFALERVWPNFLRYSGWLLLSQTPAVLLAFAVPFFWPSKGAARSAAVIICVVFPIALLGLYLPYFIYDVWWFLRFLLPGYPGLCIGVAGVAVALTRRASRAWVRAGVPAFLVMALAVYGMSFSNGPWGDSKAHDERYLHVTSYVAQLPARSVFISLAHSGSIPYYTGRDTLRWEALSPGALDRTVPYLRDKGYSVYLVVDRGEISGFMETFARTHTVGELHDTPPIDVIGALVYPLGGTDLPPAPQLFTSYERRRH